MKGADAIIRCRISGMKPAKVRIVDGKILGDSSPAICGAFEVEIEPRDRLAMLDMRWAIGLDVDVMVADHETAKRLFDALVSVQVGRAFAYGYDAPAGALKTYRIEAGEIEQITVKG